MPSEITWSFCQIKGVWWEGGEETVWDAEVFIISRTKREEKCPSFSHTRGPFTYSFLSVFMWSVAVALLSFLIWVLGAFSPFVLVTLARNLSIVLLFPKNQLFVSLILSLVSLFSVSLVSVLIFISSSFPCFFRLKLLFFLLFPKVEA